MEDSNKNEKPEESAENKEINPPENQNAGPGQPAAPDDPYKTLKLIGTVLLVLIGIPLLIFGICILLLR